MGQKVLVQYDSNYADEFDVSGFCVMTKADWEKHAAKATDLFNKRAAKPLPEPDKQYSRRNQEARQVEVYFGTNESMIYETLDCYLRSFKITELADADLKTLQKFFGKDPHQGMVVMIDDYVFEEEDES
jgi:hypothetical protein